MDDAMDALIYISWDFQMYLLINRFKGWEDHFCNMLLYFVLKKRITFCRVCLCDRDAWELSLSATLSQQKYCTFKEPFFYSLFEAYLLPIESNPRTTQLPNFTRNTWVVISYYVSLKQAHTHSAACINGKCFWGEREVFF